MEKQNKTLKDDLDISKKQLKFHLSRNSSPSDSSEEIAKLKVELEALKLTNSQNALLISDLRSQLELKEGEKNSAQAETRQVASKLKAMTKKYEAAKDDKDSKMKSLNQSLSTLKSENKRIMQKKTKDMDKIRDDILKDLKVEMNNRLKVMFPDMEVGKDENAENTACEKATNFQSKFVKRADRRARTKKTPVKAKTRKLDDDSSSGVSDIEDDLLASLNKKTPVKILTKTQAEVKNDPPTAPDFAQYQVKNDLPKTPDKAEIKQKVSKSATNLVLKQTMKSSDTASYAPPKRRRRSSEKVENLAKRPKRHFIYNVESIFEFMIPMETLPSLLPCDAAIQEIGLSKPVFTDKILNNPVKSDNVDADNELKNSCKENVLLDSQSAVETSPTETSVKTSTRKWKSSFTEVGCSNDVVVAAATDKPQVINVTDPDTAQHSTCNTSQQEQPTDDTIIVLESKTMENIEIKEDDDEIKPVIIPSQCSVVENAAENRSSSTAKECSEAEVVQIETESTSGTIVTNEFAPFVASISIKNDTAKTVRRSKRNVLTIKPEVPNPVLSALGNALTAKKKPAACTPKKDILIIDFKDLENHLEPSTESKIREDTSQQEQGADDSVIAPEDIECAYEMDVVSGEKLMNKVKRLNKMLSIDAEFDYRSTKRRACVRKVGKPDVTRTDTPNLASAVNEDVNGAFKLDCASDSKELVTNCDIIKDAMPRKRKKLKVPKYDMDAIFDLFVPYPTLSELRDDVTPTLPPSNLLDLTAKSYRTDKQLVTKAIIDCFRQQFAADNPDIDFLVNTFHYNFKRGTLEHPEDKLARVIKNELFLRNSLREEERPPIALFVNFFMIFLQKLNVTNQDSSLNVAKLRMDFLNRIFNNLSTSKVQNNLLFISLMDFATQLSIASKIHEPLQYFLMHMILMHTQHRQILIYKIVREVLNNVDPCDIIEKEQLSAVGSNITKIHVAGLEFCLRYFMKDYKGKEKLTYVHQFAIEDHLLDSAFKILVTNDQSKNSNNQVGIYVH